MGIIIPPPPPPGPDCFCWPAGETPEFLYLSISGMTRGSWMPWWKFEEGPNGVWPLERTGANAWGFSSADFDFNYSTKKPGSQVIAAVPGVEFSFSGWDDENCIFAFDNVSGTGPLDLWYGGRAQLIWSPPSGLESLTDIAALTGLVPGVDVRAEAWPLTDTEFVAMFADIRDATRIHQKIDITHRDQYLMFDK